MIFVQFIKVLLRLAIVVLLVGCLYLFIKAPAFFVHNNMQVLNVLAWPQVLDQEFLKEFETKKKVRINISYCENNDEMLAKLRGATHHGYDIVMCSDFFLESLLHADMIQPIDRRRLDFWDTIDPHLKNVSFDKANRYSIPCFWTVYGLGVRTKNNDVDLNDVSWGLIFDRQYTPPVIGMMEGIHELIALSALYFLGKRENITPDEIGMLTEKLAEQKKSVVAYSEMRAEYLLASGACSIVMAQSSDIAKMVKQFSDIAFVIPKEGSFFVLDSFTITKQSKKEGLAYEFLNYFYSQPVIDAYAEKFNFPSPIIASQYHYPLPNIHFASSNMPPLSSLSRFLTIDQIEKIMLTIKNS